MPFRFEGLEIWKLARRFSSVVERVAREFPSHELYGLRSQMTRAADAVPLLIAEGVGLPTRPLVSHRMSLAIAEVFEVASAAFLALDRGYIDEGTHAELYEAADELSQKISNFRTTLAKRT